MDHNDPAHYPRQTFLTVFLGGSAFCFLLGVLIFISLGAFLWVLLFAVAIGLFAGLHYLLWGWFMSQGMANEIEEEQLRQRAEADWPPPDDYRIRRP
jgi:hypothetical protein